MKRDGSSQLTFTVLLMVSSMFLQVAFAQEGAVNRCVKYYQEKAQSNDKKVVTAAAISIMLTFPYIIKKSMQGMEFSKASHLLNFFATKADAKKTHQERLKKFVASIQKRVPNASDEAIVEVLQAELNKDLLCPKNKNQNENANVEKARKGEVQSYSDIKTHVANILRERVGHDPVAYEFFDPGRVIKSLKVGETQGQNELCHYHQL